MQPWSQRGLKLAMPVPQPRVRSRVIGKVGAETNLLFVLGCCQRFWRRVVLFEISSAPGTEVDSDASFAGVRWLLALLPELQHREESTSPPPNEKSAKSIFVESTRAVRFKFLAAPNSFHGRNHIAKNR
jgi:hypothetical protein